jgi:hypothetical protein
VSWDAMAKFATLMDHVNGKCMKKIESSVVCLLMIIDNIKISIVTHNAKRPHPK